MKTLATNRRTANKTLRDSLGLGKALFKQEARLQSLFPQHLLGDPLNPAKKDPSATPSLP